MDGNEDAIVRELHFLVYRFLQQSPCTETARIFRQELEQQQLLPIQYNPLTNTSAPFSLDSLVTRNSHVSGDYLLKILKHSMEAIQKVSPVPVQISNPTLLGSGRFSMLRPLESIDDVNNGASTSSPTTPFVPHSISRLSTQVCRLNLDGLILPSTHAGLPHPQSLSRSLMVRQISGPLPITQLVPTALYKDFTHYRRLLGHLASIYCLQFDKTGRYVFTGADDSLIKIWSTTSGRLLMSLRGHKDEISDLAVNIENTLLASGGIDHVLRVWCLRTTAPVAVLTGHTGVITAVNFCPLVRPIRYLATTSEDGTVCFWKYEAATNAFESTPIKFTEKSIRSGNKIQSASFSSGGVFFAVGSTDQYVRVYHMTAPIGPTKILEITQHCSAVDSIYFANYTSRFISGSRDGIAHIWSYEKQTWKNVPLRMNEMLPGCTEPIPEESRNVIVNNMCWSCDDAYIVVSVSDFTIKIWNSKTAKLFNILRGHEEKVYTLDAHPKDPRILLSAGHDGAIFIWDMIRAERLQSFLNVVEGQGVCEIYDCKWSPDGMKIAATDIHGHISFFGLGKSNDYKRMPDQVCFFENCLISLVNLFIVFNQAFFHTDYRPLLRDANHYVIDEQTQLAPHLMPPPFLVDIDGNPHPPEYQRLVPGRENCLESQLVPYVADSFMEMQPAQQQRVTIDDMIQQLAGNNNAQAPPQANQPAENGQEPQPEEQREVPAIDENQRNRGANRNNNNAENVPREGVRQSQNFLSIGNAMMPVWHKKHIVDPLDPARVAGETRRLNMLAEDEDAHYATECKKKPEKDEVRMIKELTKRQLFTRSKQRVIRERRGVRYPDFRELTLNELENFDCDDERDRDFDGNEAPESSESETSSDDDSDWDNGATNSNSRSRNSGRARASGPVPGPSGSAGVQAEADVGEDEQNSNRPRRSEVEEREDRRAQRRQRLSEIRAIRRRRYAQQFNQVQEVPEIFRPPEWLTDSRPKRTPYFPQIGDEVVYFRSGHQNYLDVVKDKQIYNLSSSNKPFKLRGSESDEIFARVVNIKYYIKPPRLVSVKLNIIDPDAENPNTNISFTIRYHDVANVVDFIILKKLYDLSISRNWQVGDEFRSVIDDRWWFGTINSIRHLEPYTWFQSFKVVWSNGDAEFLSPWDMEPIVEQVPEELKTEGIVLTEDDHLSFNLINENEWSEEEKQRLMQGFARIMEFAFAEDFTAPVDLNVHPVYATAVPYMMDLSTIRSRIENNFYRRKDMIRFDVGFIEANAEIYNEADSEIVKKAKIITDVCRRFISDDQCFDPMPIYLEVSQNWNHTHPSPVSRSANSSTQNEQLRRSSRRPRLLQLSDSDNEHRPRSHSLYGQPSTSAGGHGGRSLGRSSHVDPQDERKCWKHYCRELLDDIFRKEDSVPFRSAVDPIIYPDYIHVIDTPMDLSTVKEQLLADNYESLNDFAKDMRLIFSNSRQFNTKKKSLIYRMTNRLSDYFEQRLRALISRGKSRRQQRAPRPHGSFAHHRTSSPDDPSDNDSSNSNDRPGRRRVTNTRYADYETFLPGPSTSTATTSRMNQRINNSHASRPLSSRASTSLQSRRVPQRRRFDSDDDADDGGSNDKYGLRKRNRSGFRYKESDEEDEEEDVPVHTRRRQATLAIPATENSTSNYRLRRNSNYRRRFSDHEEEEEEDQIKSEEEEASNTEEEDEAETENEEVDEEAPDETEDEKVVKAHDDTEEDDEEEEGNDSDATQVEDEGAEENKENTRTSSLGRPTRGVKRVHYEEEENDSDEGIREKPTNIRRTTARVVRTSFVHVSESSRSSHASQSSNGGDTQLRRSSRAVKRRKFSSDSGEEGYIERARSSAATSRLHRPSTSGAQHLPGPSDLYSGVKTRHRPVATSVSWTIVIWQTIV